MKQLRFLAILGFGLLSQGQDVGSDFCDPFNYSPVGPRVETWVQTSVPPPVLVQYDMVPDRRPDGSLADGSGGAFGCLGCDPPRFMEFTFSSSSHDNIIVSGAGDGCRRLPDRPAIEQYYELERRDGQFVVRQIQAGTGPLCFFSYSEDGGVSESSYYEARELSQLMTPRALAYWGPRLRVLGL